MSLSKRIIYLGLAIFCFQHGFSQEYKLTAFKKTWIPLPPDGATYTWEDVNLPVDCNFTGNKIKIGGKENVEINLVQLRRNLVEQSDTFLTYRARDARGTDLKVIFTKFASHHNSQEFELAIDYADKEVHYKLKK